MKEFLSPEMARAQGYIPIDEARKIRPADRSTYVRQAQNGLLPAVKVLKGSRQVWWVLANAIGKQTSLKTENAYERLRDKWIELMELGVCSHRNRPVSKKYTRNLLWSLEYYWNVLGETPTIAGINAENFSRVMATFKVDEIERKDFHATKNNIYKACIRFTNFLIEEGLKTLEDKDAFKKHLPGKRYKAKKRMLDEEYIQEAIKFNRNWFDGRKQYDVDVLDILLHLYTYAGIRKMEAAWLRLSDIDFKNDLMIVFGKGSKERYVPLDLFPQLKPKLQEWINRKRPETASELLIVQENGKPLTETSIGQRCSRLSDAMRLEKLKARMRQQGKNPDTYPKEELKKLSKSINFAVRPHDLRRTFATMCAANDMPLTMLQEILGHEDINTTMGYILISIKHIQEWNRKKQQAAEPEIKQKGEVFNRTALFDRIKKQTIG